MTALKKSKKVLIVDDDIATQEAVVAKFKLLGYEADVAEDGEVAIRKLHEGSYLGVLLDLQMPHKDGYAFLENRKNDPLISRTPVIVFSNYSIPEVIERVHILGIDSYFVKAHHSIEEIVTESIHGFEEYHR